MKNEIAGKLELGSNVIELLIPHRSPFLLVDGIESFQSDAPCRLWARKQISANEEIFRGHFPNLHLWPGVYTQEGLGQTCNLLCVLRGFQKGWAEQGGDPEDVLKALRNLELGYRLHPGFRPEMVEKLWAPLQDLHAKLGVASAAEIKFLQPVFAGQRLDYHVCLTHEFDNQLRFEIEARVAEKTVAQGVLSSVWGLRLPTSEVPK